MARNDEFIARPYPDRLSTEELKATRALVSGDGIAALIRASCRPANQDVTMGTPPTITVGTADAATTISGGVDVGWADSRLTYSTAVAQVSGSYPDTTLAKPVYLDSAADGAAASLDTGRSVAMSFATGATVFEVMAKGFSLHRVWVIEEDNIPRALAVQTMASTGSVYRVKYDFGGSRKQRRIVVQFDRAVGGICLGPTESVSVWAPPGPKVAIVGDSITESTGSNVLACYAQRLVERLGCPFKLINFGIGNTGWVATNSGTRKNARGITDSCLIASAPDVVIWAHGLNDSADVTTNAAYCVDAVRQALPNAVQIMFMPFQPRSITGVAPTRTQMLAVAATRPWLTVIDLTTYGSNPEVTGTGRVGATTGTGNSDWWTGSDATHPTQDGHNHSANVRDAAIRAALKLP